MGAGASTVTWTVTRLCTSGLGRIGEVHDRRRLTSPRRRATQTPVRNQSLLQFTRVQPTPAPGGSRVVHHLAAA
jgi:hypothetical protein